MADPFVGEIKINAFGFAPKGWSACDGQLLTISQNQALASLLRTYYGGNGQTTFALPDLRGRTPIHFGVSPQGTAYNMGSAVGQENVSVTISTMPQHNHPCYGIAAAGTKSSPNGNFYAQSSSPSIYVAPSALTPLHPSTVSNAGGSQAHNNMQPSLSLNFCIAMVGIYPPRQ